MIDSDFNTIKVLDHGYVKLIESWGSDERIIEAARISTNKGFQGWGPIHDESCKSQQLKNVYDAPDDWLQSLDLTCNCTPKSGDEKLLSYLYTHKHMTPFEMCGATFEIQAPIFVFREWHRHRTQSYNELSARYTPLPDLNYIPTTECVSLSDPKNKQSTGLVNISQQPENIQSWLDDLAEVYEHCQSVYQAGLDIGVPKELARLCVPVARYSRMRASANLRNWLHFLSLRMDFNAQYEIRVYAVEIGNIISELFPRTWKLFNTYLP